jgi:hypothetical protein
MRDRGFLLIEREWGARRDAGSNEMQWDIMVLLRLVRPVTLGFAVLDCPSLKNSSVAPKGSPATDEKQGLSQN